MNTLVEHELLPFELLTVREKVLCADSIPVVHEPPVDPEKVVHVPLCGENMAYAGPSEMPKFRTAVWPDWTTSGLGVILHVGVMPPPVPPNPLPGPPPLPPADGLIAMDRVLEEVLAPASVTVIVNEYVPSAEGVPDMVPVEEFKARPTGSPPAVTAHAYDELPPVALNVTGGYV